MGRPSLSVERLSEREDGDLEYTLKKEWSDGTTKILLSPFELIEKLSAIIPPPGLHMSRYGGVFGSAHPWRKEIVKRPEIKKGFIESTDLDGKKKTKRINFSELLSRVFKIDLVCKSCGSEMQMKGTYGNPELYPGQTVSSYCLFLQNNKDLSLPKIRFL